MVEPVNYQHTLARTQIAEKLQDTAKQHQMGDEKVFADELQKLEHVREMEVKKAEQDQEGVKVREHDEKSKKRGRDDTKKNKKQDGEAVDADASPDGITDDPDHHIDITI